MNKRKNGGFFECIKYFVAILLLTKVMGFNSNEAYFISILSFLDVVRRDQYSNAFFLRELHHVFPHAATKMHFEHFFLFIFSSLMRYKKKRNPLASPLELGPVLQWVRPKSEVRACGSKRQRMKLSSADRHSYFLPDDFPGVVEAILREIPVLCLRKQKIAII